MSRGNSARRSCSRFVHGAGPKSTKRRGGRRVGNSTRRGRAKPPRQPAHRGRPPRDRAGRSPGSGQTPAGVVHASSKVPVPNKQDARWATGWANSARSGRAKPQWQRSQAGFLRRFLAPFGSNIALFSCHAVLPGTTPDPAERRPSIETPVRLALAPTDRNIAPFKCRVVLLRTIPGPGADGLLETGWQRIGLIDPAQVPGCATRHRRGAR